MREIKFRVWSKLDRKMYEVEQIDFIRGNVNIPQTETETVPTLFGCYELMQYTGFKDENKKKGFHKDIVRYQEKDGSFYFIVEWSDIDGHWYLKSVEDDDYNEVISFLEQCEIIGNTFENPKLLPEGENAGQPTSNAEGKGEVAKGSKEGVKG